MLRATLKSLLAKKVRLALTALSIVLGVGFMAGTFVLTDTINKTFDELFAQVSSGVDVIVRSESAFRPGETGPGGGGGGDEREPVPEDLLARVESIPGVARATGDVSGYAQLVDPDTGDAIGGVGPPTIGSSWDGQTGIVELREGTTPAGPDEVAVDAVTAREHGLAVGGEVRILFQGPALEFTISGIVGFGEADNLAGATLALFDPVTAQMVLGKEGVFDGISLVADECVSSRELRARVAAQLPDGIEAITGSDFANEQASAVQEGLGFFRTALLVFAFVALFVGAFIIFNTFSIIVAQRTRELALLRALGASRRQVTVSVLVEAVVVGVIAALLGVVAGLGIALGLQALLEGFGIDLPSTTTQLLPRTVIASLVVGAGITLLSSVLPARRASRVAPIQAMRDQQADADGATARRRVVIGLVVLGAGAASLLYGLFGSNANAAVLVGVGAAVTFVGIAILSPLIARPLARAIGAPLQRLGRGIPAKLGRENAMRNPRRTASTAAALMIGLGLVSFVTVFGASLRDSASAVLDETLKADFILTTESFTPFSPQVAEDLSTLPELSAVSAVRSGELRIGGKAQVVSAVDPATIDRVAAVEIVSGSLEGLRTGMLVHADVAEERGWRVGRPIRVEFARTGSTELVLEGTYAEDDLLGDYLVSIETFEANFTEQLDFIVFATRAGGTSIDDARAAIDGVLADVPNVNVSNQAEFKEQQADAINQALALVTVLLVLAVVISLVGIVNTLGLSIYERIRELGLVRAVGMSRGQVARMIVVESVIIAILGSILGVVIGVLFGWAMQQALAGEGISRLSIPVGQLLASMVVAGLAGVIAAIGPAIRAARINVLQAIAYE